MAVSERFVKVDFRDAGVQRGLRFFKGHRKALQRVFKQMRVPLREDLQRYATQESGPDGSWPKRKQETERRIKRRARFYTTTKRGKSPKGRSDKGRFVRASGPVRSTVTKRDMSQLLGRLPVAVSTTARGSTLTAQSKVPWSGVHNDGGVAGHGAKIPQREFVFISPPFLVQFVSRVEAAMTRGWREA
jgi:phage gpG-like protein